MSSKRWVALLIAIVTYRCDLAYPYYESATLSRIRARERIVFDRTRLAGHVRSITTQSAYFFKPLETVNHVSSSACDLTCFLDERFRQALYFEGSLVQVHHLLRI